MNRYRIALAILAICATITLLSVPVITTTEARSILPAKVVLFKSTTETLRISAVNPAFLDNLSAGAMAIIAANPLVEVNVHYGTTLLRGYTGSAAVGTGETLGANLLNALDLTDGWTQANAKVVDADTFNTTVGNGYVLKTLTSYGKLYKASLTGNATGGTLMMQNAGGVDVGVYVVAGAGTAYRTAASPNILLRNDSIATNDITAANLQAVTAPSVNGCLLYNSAAMSVQSLAVNTFVMGSYNQSAYTVIFSRPR